MRGEGGRGGEGVSGKSGGGGRRGRKGGEGGRYMFVYVVGGSREGGVRGGGRCNAKIPG